MKASERVGKKYEMLTVDSYSTVGEGRKTRTVFHCTCECGGKSDQTGGNLERVISCGCHRQSRSDNKVSDMPEYAIWEQMNQRCHNKRCRVYKNYGARGIRVCAKWRATPGEKTARAFKAFLAHVGPRPEGDGWSIERKRNSGDYAPGNVRWARDPEQNRNKRNNHPLTFRGRTQVVTDWAKETNISVPTILRRLNEGMSIAKALTTPTEMRGRKVWAADRGLLKEQS
jgi:hypothetical protein